MKIIYDDTLHGKDRVKIIFPDGSEKPCACFDIKVESTDIEKEKPSVEMKFSRWGKISERNKIHKKISELFKKEAKNGK